jgi:toxin FitB
VNYLLDTNVISELVASQPNSNVIRWIEEVDPDRIYLSVIAIGELKKGIEKLPDSKRKERLAVWLQEDLFSRFQDHIFPIDIETMLAWGAITAKLEAAGRPISAMDALLAATAKQHHCTLVTRNTAHFGNTGIQLINPWAD